MTFLLLVGTLVYYATSLFDDCRLYECNWMHVCHIPCVSICLPTIARPVEQPLALSPPRTSVPQAADQYYDHA